MKKSTLLLITTIFLVVNTFAITITGNTTWGVPGSTTSSYLPIPNTVIIESGAVLTIVNSFGNFSPNKGIIIEDGGKLVLDHTVLSCNTLNSKWNGIEVKDHLISNPSYNNEIAIEANFSTISNAKQGVYNSFSSGGQYKSKSIIFTHGIFRDNNNHIYLDYSSSNILSNNTIIKFDDVNFSGYLGSISQSTNNFEVFVRYGANITFNNSTFKSKASTNSGIGLLLKQCSNVFVTNNFFKHQVWYGVNIIRHYDNLTINGNNFEVLDDRGLSADYLGVSIWHFYNGIVIASWFENTSDVININDNNFYTENNAMNAPGNMPVGIISDLGMTKLNVINNTFTGMFRGVFALDSHPEFLTLNIKKNTFQYYGKALDLSNISSRINISCNHFLEGVSAMIIKNTQNNSGSVYSNYFNGPTTDVSVYGSSEFSYDILNGSVAPQSIIGPLDLVFHDPFTYPSRPCNNKQEFKMSSEMVNPELLNNNNVISLINLEINSNIIIRNSLGQVVETMNTYDSEINLETSLYNSGIYFVNIESGVKRTVLKFVK